MNSKWEKRDNSVSQVQEARLLETPINVFSLERLKKVAFEF